MSRNSSVHGCCSSVVQLPEQTTISALCTLTCAPLSRPTTMRLCAVSCAASRGAPQFPFLERGKFAVVPRRSGSSKCQFVVQSSLLGKLG